MSEAPLRKRILIIDDDPRLRLTVRACLEQNHFETLEAETPHAGIILAGAQRPDLVLCDLHLGSGNGLDVLAELRRNRTTGTIPVIIITGTGDATAMRRGIR